MLGNYERRHFDGGKKVWIGHYENLVNVLHWHFECEIIRVVKGNAQIKIGNYLYQATDGDSFFCSCEDLHYIISEPNARVDIMILDKSIGKDITDKYTLLSPMLPKDFSVVPYFDTIEKTLSNKGILYREVLENQARNLILEMFRNCETTKSDDKSRFYKNLISKINNEFSYITFKEAVSYSGYSPAHFSKMFKALSGMNFSDYLNIIKIENAIIMMRGERNMTMTSIALKCGFSTVRNFNKVFKELTGYSPRTLPADFIIETGTQIAKDKDFDPTQKSSVLMLS